jgi:cytochrome c-type biogenesis protein CcmH/NrfG
MTEAETSGGVKAGLAKYRELRVQFFGGQQYDFTENSLLTMAQRALTAKKPAEAIQYLEANLEYFPKSVRSHVAMSQAKAAAGDMRGAVDSAERAVALDPKNVPAQNQLRQVKAR